MAVKTLVAVQAAASEAERCPYYTQAPSERNIRRRARPLRAPRQTAVRKALPHARARAGRQTSWAVSRQARPSAVCASAPRAEDARAKALR